jgi:very-short-patch-repair endonuclease
LSERGKISWNNTNTKRECVICKSLFPVSPSDKKYTCSQECHNKYVSKYMKEKWNCPEYKQKVIKTMRERMTPERRARMSKGQRGKIVNIESIKKSLQRREMSSIEKKFNRIIVKYKMPFNFVGNGGCFVQRKNPDFIHLNKKVAIDVYWKKHKEHFRDMTIDEWKSSRTQIFKEEGWKLFFFDETQINEDFILFTLKEYLSSH